MSEADYLNLTLPLTYKPTHVNAAHEEYRVYLGDVTLGHVVKAHGGWKAYYPSGASVRVPLSRTRKLAAHWLSATQAEAQEA